MGFLDRVFGGGADDDDPQRQADIARVAAGGVPLAAEHRIKELAEGKTAFTSGLSVSDFALARLDGVRPVCQVMGSSVYKVGWQGRPQRFGGGGLVTELRQLTDAWNHARSLALRRLAEEARLAGCHAVVDVRFAGNRHEFFSDEIEIVVNGTAVHLPEGGEHPILTDLSMPDYTLLRNTGYRPVGVVASTSVFYIVPTGATRRATNSLWQPNQELRDFTEGVYAAREMALSRANGQVEYFGGAGMVGMRIEHHVATRESGGDNNRRIDLIVTFHVLGTAIADAAEHRPLEPRTIVRQGAR
jgi:uncharacterized protein YbjQ (UPF0145 family)